MAIFGGSVTWVWQCCRGKFEGRSGNVSGKEGTTEAHRCGSTPVRWVGARSGSAFQQRRPWRWMVAGPAASDEERGREA
jgi:hypothetical protein